MTGLPKRVPGLALDRIENSVSDCPVCLTPTDNIWSHFQDNSNCGTRVIHLAKREAELMRSHGKK
jgi:hypothetical protein